MENIRQAAVAGQFYPGNPARLRKMLRDFLEEAKPNAVKPKALIAPHAGYIYSGPIAASAYAQLAKVGPTILSVVLLGPAHRVPLRGLAVSSVDAFATPLGKVQVDQEAVKEILKLPQVHVRDDAHAFEHSLEVHLPFLQSVCGRFSIVPLVVGEASAEEVAEVLLKLWGGPETLIVISSDLSHYLDYETARKLDGLTSKAIERLEPEAIGRDQACGSAAIKGLLLVARQLGLRAHIIDVRNSGDTAGSRREVVGYGAYVFA